ncbi:hypothetical protein BHE74_00030411 [Ensete ventricosum]|nr:hypothetical protein GW17_00039321 [Ensete ventricosum]RWW62455.1 hypothetical protein BHE74_00030411 [Ensete ventricosum]RZS03398.1 hypothetical protein BHM03_00033577 [Ensete ventricosum]
MGNGSYGSSGRGKKSSSGKRKQPQRGFGVAQLEKIRLQNEMLLLGCSPSLHSPFVGDLNKVGFGGSTGQISDMADFILVQHQDRSLLHHENDLLLPLHLLQTTLTLPLIEQSLEVHSTNVKIYASTDSYFK